MRALRRFLLPQDRQDGTFALCVLMLIVGLLLMPDFFTPAFVDDVNRWRAEVHSVDNSELSRFGIVRIGDQRISATLLEGPLQGREIEADNRVIGKMEVDKIFRPGDVALVAVETEGGRIISASAYDHYRLDTELLLFGIFALLLMAFAGWTGIKSMLSFAFATLLIWKVLVPGLLLGWDPIALALGVVSLLAGATMFLVAGLNRTGVVALIGALLGVSLTYGLAQVLFPPFRLHGAVMSFSETLLYSGFADLNLERIFLAGIFIGASGAVMDLAIDVAAGVGEVIKRRPDLTFAETVASGLAIGRAMTSTMVTTLLMAYAAGYVALLMLFMGQGIPPGSILNTNYVSAAVLKTVVGSFGLVTVAPFTAVVGGLVFARRRQSAFAANAATAESPAPAGE